MWLSSSSLKLSMLLKRLDKNGLAEKKRATQEIGKTTQL
jgi:hypothetical protein